MNDKSIVKLRMYQEYRAQGYSQKAARLMTEREYARLVSGKD